LLRSPAGRELVETLTLIQKNLHFWSRDTIEIAMEEIRRLAVEIKNFADARDWEQFHTPKNLSMAVSGEAGELVAEFQWLTPEESMRSGMSREKLEAVELEIADVAIYLIRLADVLDLDISEAVLKKLAINEKRF
jgi:dCTP diphosphatase